MVTRKPPVLLHSVLRYVIEFRKLSINAITLRYVGKEIIQGTIFFSNAIQNKYDQI